MKKIYFCSLVIFLLSFIISVPIFTDAADSTFSLTIIEQTWGRDESFNFDLTSSGGGVVFNFAKVAKAQSQYSFNVPTINLKGSITASDLDAMGLPFYMLQQRQQGSWSLDSRHCVSDNLSQIFTYDNNNKYVVYFSAIANSHITCTFTNVFNNAKNPVLIVPGIMGTEIYRGTEVLWPDVPDMLKPWVSDSFMDPLAYKDEDATPIDTTLSLGKVISKLPRFDYTEKIINEFKNQGYIENQNLFLFPYDWRKDLADIANNEFKSKINELLDIPGVGKIDIIAHSQGGLVFKRFLYENPAYLSSIDKAVFVGTPNLGAPVAAKALLYGDSMGISFGPLGLDPAEVKYIAHNMPSVYELLPSYEYFAHNNGIGYLGSAELQSNLPLYHITTKDFGQTYDYLTGDGGLNADLVSRADSFHDYAYDNFDFTGTGIKAYNIVGCQDATMSKIVQMPNGEYDLDYGPGDTTVPFISAKNLNGALTFYALKADHGQMLSQDGIKQQIVSIIAGNGSLASDNITTISTDCHFNGRKVSSHSPVALQIYDTNNNQHVGPNPDGSFDYQIEGVQYDTIGEEKFAFLPPGHDYKVVLEPKLTAGESGQFDFYSAVITDSQIASSVYYNQVPINSSSKATLALNEENSQQLQLDVNGDGKNLRIFSPAPVLGANEPKDLTAPVSTSTLAGLMGQPGFYRGNVTINLSAIDPVVEGQPTSGVLKTQYQIFKATTDMTYRSYQTYTGPFSLSEEGWYTISFFSTDNAGNNEPEQTVSFTIDKTPPEFVMQFNPALKDLEFIATDTLPTTLATGTAALKLPSRPHPMPPVKLKDNDNVITATDAAGNTAVLTLKDKDRKRQLKAEIKSLSYNGKLADINKTLFHFDWLFDKKGKLQLLTQQLRSKKDFNILAIYGLNKTVITGRDQSGKIKQTLPGLVLLKVSTNQGDFNWSYKVIN